MTKLVLAHESRYVIKEILASTLSDREKQLLTTLVQNNPFIRQLMYDYTVLLEIDWCIKYNNSVASKYRGVLCYVTNTDEYAAFLKFSRYLRKKCK